MADLCRKGYTGKRSRYVGPDGGQTFGAELLKFGDIVPDESGLLAVKAPALFAAIDDQSTTEEEGA